MKRIEFEGLSLIVEELPNKHGTYYGWIEGLTGHVDFYGDSLEALQLEALKSYKIYVESLITILENKLATKEK